MRILNSDIFGFSSSICHSILHWDAGGRKPITSQEGEHRYRNDVNKRYADAAKALISAGIVPTEEQLSAMGWSPEEYWIYRMANGGQYV